MNAPDLSTLAARMRFCRGVHEEVTDRYGLPPGISLSAEWLRKEADVVEAEEVEQEALVEELARDWFNAGPRPESWPGYSPTYYRHIARKLIRSGWRKGDSE